MFVHQVTDIFRRRISKATSRIKAGGAASSKRIRGYDFVVTSGSGKNAEVKQHENLSSLAKDLDVPTATLQADFFKAAGTEVLKEAPAEVKWSAQVKTEDGTKQVSIVGSRTAKEEAETSDETASE